MILPDTFTQSHQVNKVRTSCKENRISFQIHSSFHDRNFPRSSFGSLSVRSIRLSANISKFPATKLSPCLPGIENDWWSTHHFDCKPFPKQLILSPFKSPFKFRTSPDWARSTVLLSSWETFSTVWSIGWDKGLYVWKKKMKLQKFRGLSTLFDSFFQDCLEFQDPLKKQTSSSEIEKAVWARSEIACRNNVETLRCLAKTFSQGCLRTLNLESLGSVW